MASNLHYITPLALADTFNEWFLRSNDMIDVVNKINVYDVDTGFGLAKYRAVDGTTKIRINIGQGDNEYDGTLIGSRSNSLGIGVTGQGQFGLRFLQAGSTLGGATSAANPDVSSKTMVLGVDIVGLPGASGGEEGQPVSKDDYFMVADYSDDVQHVRSIKAENMLPYSISGDHRFTGKIWFDGDVTQINSTELYIDDKVIWLATSSTGDNTYGSSNDAQLDGAGFIVKGMSGDKQFILDYPSALDDPSSYISFKPNVDLNFETARALVNSNFTIFSHKSSNVQLRFSSINKVGKYYEFEAFQTGDTQSRLKIRYEDTIGGTEREAMAITPLGTIQLSNLEGDILDGGVTYENSFSWEPKQSAIPTTASGISNDKYLNYQWVNRRLVTQPNHGLSAGMCVKFYSGTHEDTQVIGVGSTFEAASAVNRASAEVVGIVEEVSAGGSADQFVVCFSGLVDLSKADFAGPTGHGPGGITQNVGIGGFTLSPGEAYFLNGTNGNIGGITAADPLIPGEIRKPVIVGVSDTVGLFVNYAGFEVGQTTGISSDFLEYNTVTGNMTTPEYLPQMTFRNKIINGDFDFWQRWEHTGGYDAAISSRDTGKLLLPPYGITHDGCSLDFNAGVTGYFADQWLIARSHRATDSDDTSKCTVSRFAATGTSQGEQFSLGGARPPRHFLRVEKNTSKGDGNVVLAHRIEDVKTFGRTASQQDVVVSYWIKHAGLTHASAGDQGQGGSTSDFTVSLLQVFNGACGEGPTYGGGATHCIAVYPNGYQHTGIATDGGQAGHTYDLTVEWTYKQHHFKLHPTGQLGNTGAAFGGGGISADHNWLELQFIIPGATAGISAGFELARVQFESGSKATRFEERPYNIEKELCERYYNIVPVHAHQRAYNDAVVPAHVPFTKTLFPNTGFSSDGIPATTANRAVVQAISMGGTGDFTRQLTLADVKSIGGFTGSLVVERTGDSATAGQFHTYNGIIHIDTSIH